MIGFHPFLWLWGGWPPHPLICCYGLGLLHVLAIVNSWGINMDVQVSLWHAGLGSFQYRPKEGVAYMTVLVFDSCRIAVGIHSTTPGGISTSSGWRFLFCHTLASICCFHGDSHSERDGMEAKSGFCSHFPMSEDIAHFLKYWLTICLSFKNSLSH